MTWSSSMGAIVRKRNEMLRHLNTCGPHVSRFALAVLMSRRPRWPPNHGDATAQGDAS